MYTNIVYLLAGEVKKGKYKYEKENKLDFGRLLFCGFDVGVCMPK